MKRRDFLRLSLAGAAGLVATACARRDGSALPTGTPEVLGTRVEALIAAGAAYGLQVFPGGLEYVAGRPNRLTLGLVDPEGFTVEAPAARIWVAGRGWERGPVETTERTYRQVVQEDDPKGFHAATVEIPETGLVDVLVSAPYGGGELFGWTTVRARAQAQVPDVGERAVAVATPTAGDLRGVANLCTRDPICPLHDRSLDAVLVDGVPVVYTISSPLLCTSRTCGPVLEEVLRLHEAHGARARFIHAEPYRGDTATDLAEAATAWRLESEPWTFVIDGQGTVAARFEGPVVAEELEPALRALTG